MQTPYEVKLLHVEPSTHCNAHCPQCERNLNGGVLNPWVKLEHLSLSALESRLDQFSKLEKVLFCGNRGDPMMCPDIVNMIALCKQRGLIVGMNTNGSIGNERQWQDIGQLLTDTRDYVVFSIDGLEDTNHLYRHGVSWSLLMRNVKTYIQHGGPAHWDMLVFDHNKHQIQDCEDLAQNLGFRWFRTKVTKRFKQPWQNTAYGVKLMPVEFFQPRADFGIVDCMAKKDCSLYLSAENQLKPCCWLATNETITGINEYYNNEQDPWPELEDLWKKHDPVDTCVRTCGEVKHSNQFKSQWNYQREFQA